MLRARRRWVKGRDFRRPTDWAESFRDRLNSSAYHATRPRGRPRTRTSPGLRTTHTSATLQVTRCSYALTPNLEGRLTVLLNNRQLTRQHRPSRAVKLEALKSRRGGRVFGTGCGAATSGSRAAAIIGPSRTTFCLPKPRVVWELAARPNLPLVHSLAALVAQCERQRVGDLVRRGGAEVRRVGHDQTDC
jgi:hypothetical protein